MRKQIAAANWKMNLTYQQAEQLIDELVSTPHELGEHQQVIFAVPFPYLSMAMDKLKGRKNVFVAAQNCYNKKAGAYTGEVSVDMLRSMGIRFVIVGHSERREYFNETNQVLAEKINLCLENDIQPIFCCGESLDTREAGKQNEFVGRQLRDSLYHLDVQQIKKVIIAYEPIWAIGTGKTASTAQAEEMHSFIRQQLAGQFGNEIAGRISILYGGSVKGSNAAELFGQIDVDGGLVGGASLNAAEFVTIINALK